MIVEYTKKHSQRVFVIENLPLLKTGRIVEMLLRSPYTLFITVRFQ